MIDLRDREFNSIDDLVQCRREIEEKVAVDVLVTREQHERIYDLVRAQSPFVSPEPAAVIRWQSMTIRSEEV